MHFKYEKNIRKPIHRISLYFILFSYIETALEQGHMITYIQRIAREWSVSFDVRPHETTRSFGNILHFSSTDMDCCTQGKNLIEF